VQPPFQRNLPRILAQIAVLLISVAGAAQPVRVAAVKPYEEISREWGKAAGVEVEVRNFDEEMAIRQVAGGKVDLALVPERLSPAQRHLIANMPGKLPHEQSVAWEALTLLVHPKNEIPFIVEREARRTLAAEGCKDLGVPVSAWTEINPSSDLTVGVEVLTPPEGSPGWRLIRDLVLDGCGKREGILNLTNDAALERTVSVHEGALGWVYRLRFVGKARALPVQAEGKSRAVLPTTETLTSGEYPFGRKIWMVWDESYPPDSPAGKLIVHAVSEAGQLTTRRLGFLPR
jgi:phosphate transport system substrate-binding protein